ncbi:hypothetical protein PInf_022151 [Phytophthora infestans]|nr:hypothetical protein PInf_022151 [Phytophthora infestans]
MADTKAGRKRKHEPSGARKRRRGRASVDGAREKTATSLGGVAAFKDMWAALTKAGWTSKKPTAKSLDTHFKYILPGRRHDGEDGVDYLLGGLAALRLIEDVCASEVATDEATHDTGCDGDAAETAVADMAELQLVSPQARRVRLVSGVGHADDIDGIKTSGDVDVGVDEAASLETVAGHGTRGGRRKGEGAIKLQAARFAMMSTPVALPVILTSLVVYHEDAGQEEDLEAVQLGEW